MKIAVLGGSFNPVHIGHFALADEVCTSLHYDKVLFVPVFKPPHKEMQNALSPEVRLQMVKLACQEDSRFLAESCEIDRGGISYTYDTISYLQKKYESSLTDKIGLIMGDDLLAGFHLWDHAKQIAEHCNIIIAQRPFTVESDKYANKPVGSYAQASYDKNLDFDISKEPLLKNAKRLSNPILPVSSTDIRTRVAEGKSFKYLVTPLVFNYIINGKLYGYK